MNSTYKVFEIDQQHYYEFTKCLFKIKKICFSTDRIQLQILTCHSIPNQDILRDDILQVFIEDQLLKKDQSFLKIDEKNEGQFKICIEVQYHYQKLKLFDNIYFKFSDENNPACKILTIKDQDLNQNQQNKFQGTINFSQISHNILGAICLFLLPHESLNFFQSFKSNGFNRLSQEPTIWQQYAKYLELDFNDEQICRQSFLQKYKDRQLGFELKECKSVYNLNYFCYIKQISFNLKNIKIDFRVQGNYSLGGLQNPTSSKLQLDNIKLQLSQDLCRFKEEQKSNQQIYEGFLIYQYPQNFKIVSGLRFVFEYGSYGYSNKQIFQISNQNIHKFELFNLF